jgi:hypothetical protein
MVQMAACRRVRVDERRFAAAVRTAATRRACDLGTMNRRPFGKLSGARRIVH